MTRLREVMLWHWRHFGGQSPWWHHRWRHRWPGHTWCQFQGSQEWIDPEGCTRQIIGPTIMGRIRLKLTYETFLNARFWWTCVPKFTTQKWNIVVFTVTKIPHYKSSKIFHAGRGCCNSRANRTSRYNCRTCQFNRCCKVYEHCVSCCLQPHKRKLLEKVLLHAHNSRNPLLHLVHDTWELCLHKCRTSSTSVLRENTYRDAVHKYCYGLDVPHKIVGKTITGTGLRRWWDNEGLLKICPRSWGLANLCCRIQSSHPGWGRGGGYHGVIIAFCR